MSVGTAIAIAGVALGAHSVIKGLKSGNMLQAVMGGVSAYFGATALGAQAATANTASAISGTGQGAAGGLASGGAGMGAKAMQSMSTVLPDASNVATGAGIAGSGGAELGSAGMDAAFSDFNANIGDYGVGADFAGSGASVAPGTIPASGGPMSGIMNWTQKNPFLTAGAMQLGGGLLQGYDEQQRFDELMDYKEDARKRRQTTGNIDFVRNTTYNPSTGRFERTS